MLGAAPSTRNRKKPVPVTPGPPLFSLCEAFASSEIYKVQVLPIAAGHVTWIGPNIDAVAIQPGLEHCAVLLALLTTNVLVASDSLLMTICAFIVSVNATSPKLMAAK